MNESPRVTFITARIRVGHLVSMYVQWTGYDLALSDDVSPETINAMVLAYHKGDDDYLLGWKSGEKYPAHHVSLVRYHNPLNSAMMMESQRVQRMTDYLYGIWVPGGHRICRCESTIAGYHLQGSVCAKCGTHNPYADPLPYIRRGITYVCQGCTSWAGTIFHPTADAAMSADIPPDPVTEPELPK